MNDTTNSHACERASDLIAFLYNEAIESEKRDFELHLQQCSNCSEEVASFGLVRESITAWRDEALSGVVATAATPLPGRKSALAAFRQFFDLSPLWLKGATALAFVAFCVLGVVAIVRLKAPEPALTVVNPGAVYTQQDVNRMIKDALARQQNTAADTPAIVVNSPKPKRIGKPAPSQIANPRRPLSRAEREQLAADLRLLSTQADADLNLLGDRINQ